MKRSRLSALQTLSLAMTLGGVAIPDRLVDVTSRLAERNKSILREHFRVSHHYQDGKPVKLWRCVHTGELYESAREALDAFLAREGNNA